MSRSKFSRADFLAGHSREHSRCPALINGNSELQSAEFAVILQLVPAVFVWWFEYGDASAASNNVSSTGTNSVIC
jgi:hypothetical protein